MYPINNNSPNDQYLGGFPQLTPTQNKTISSQLEKTICKIHKLDGKNATGFLCKIPFPDNSNLMPVLITNNHVLNKEDIQLFKTIKVTLGNDKIEKYIKLDESRIVYTSSDESIDVTIIEIKPNIDGFKHFLDVDDKIFATNYVDVYQKKPVYILQYPQGKESSHSEGIINKINDKIIEHSCSVDFCSSGAPILKLSSFKVIGVHKKLTNGNVNEGTLIQFIINYFYDKYYNKKPSNNQKKNNNYNNKDPNQQYIGNNMRNFYEPDPDEKKTKIVKVDYPTFESNIFNVQENNNNQPNNNFNTPNNDFNNPKDDYNSPNNDFNTPNNDFNTPNNDFNKPNNDFNTPTQIIISQITTIICQMVIIIRQIITIILQIIIIILQIIIIILQIITIILQIIIIILQIIIIIHQIIIIIHQIIIIFHQIIIIFHQIITIILQIITIIPQIIIIFHQIITINHQIITIIPQIISINLKII